MIVNKPPFFHVHLAFSKDRSESVISAVRSFAKANSRSLNLKAVHVAAFAKGVDVFTIANSDPTPQQKALVREFVGKVKEAGAQRSTEKEVG